MHEYKIPQAYAQKVLRRTGVLLPVLISIAGVASVMVVYIVSGYQFAGHGTALAAIVLVHVALLAACLLSHRANAAYFNSFTLTITPHTITLQTAHKTTTIDTDKIAIIATHPDQSVAIISRTGRKRITIPACIDNRDELLATLTAIRPLSTGTTTQPPTLLRNAVILTTMVCSAVAAFTTSHTVLLICLAVMGCVVAGGSIYIIASPTTHPRMKLFAKIALVVMVIVAVAMGYKLFS